MGKRTGNWSGKSKERLDNVGKKESEDVSGLECLLYVSFLACSLKVSPPAGLCLEPHAADFHLNSCVERERSGIGKPILNFRGTLFKSSMVL